MNHIISRDEWIDLMMKSKESLEVYNSAFYDIQGANFLLPIIAGYMPAPVTVYNDKPVAAQTVKFDDIKELLDSMLASNDRILLYMLIYFPSIPVYTEINAETFETVHLDRPVFTKGMWQMRFAKA